MIDILNKSGLFARIGKLREEDLPAFGAMSPQHMVEHLAFTVGFSNGNAPQQQHYPVEKEQKIKAFIIDSDNDMPISFKSPVLPAEGLPELKEVSLAAAVAQLDKEISDFEHFFSLNPAAQPINPTMGALNYKEWLRFHNRHFTHHFKQFNLV